jgi:hypothetical protein
MNTRHVMDEVLCAAAEQLDPILQERLEFVLKGNSWIELLKIMDNLKGFKAQSYAPTDLRPQLRVLRLNLSKIGNPFWDGTGKLQRKAFALKSYRDQWAHMASFTVADCVDAAGTAAALFEYLDAQTASAVMRAKAADIALEPGSNTPIDKQAEPQRLGELVDVAIIEATGEAGEAEAEAIEPDVALLTRENLPHEALVNTSGMAEATQPLTAIREEYEAWTLVRAGEPWVIQGLPKKVAKERVRGLATDIVEFEGPVHLDRLARLIAWSFGVGKLHNARLKQIANQVRATPELFVDSDKFVWPQEIDPDSWREFRPNSSAARRAFEDISPIEIANAGEVIVSQNRRIFQDELERQMLQTFGRKARTLGAKKHLARALKVMKSRDLISHL